MNKDVKEFVGRLRSIGIEPRHSSNGLIGLYKGGVQLVTTKGVPISLHGTPSDFRWRENTIARLRAAGIDVKSLIKERKVHDSSRDTEGLKKARAVREEQMKAEQEKTRRMKVRIENVVLTKLGGAKKRGTQPTVARAAWQYLRSRNRVEAWPTEGATIQSLKSVTGGGTVSPKALTAWDVFVSHLETVPDPVERTYELAREALGAPPKNGTLLTVPESQKEEPVAPPLMTPLDPPSQPPKLQDDYVLALEAMWYVARGAAPDERDHAIELVRKLTGDR